MELYWLYLSKVWPYSFFKVFQIHKLLFLSLPTYYYLFKDIILAPQIKKLIVVALVTIIYPKMSIVIYMNTDYIRNIMALNISVFYT